ncbi:UNVERIFIED_ORG: EAL domain-containing protein (putative c-di-GMP-specific phosphodiesterase class I) [Burkholderia sp. 1263]
MTDTEVAEAVFAAMREDRVKLRFEPVCSTVDGSVVLYHECLTDVTDATGRRIDPMTFVPALQRVDLIRAYDRYVVRRVIGLLRSTAAIRLGVNISGRSAVLDVIWEAALLCLAFEPSIAARLVVEITETEPVARGRTRVFADRLRATGCLVAIDDFGAGYGVDTAMEIRSPDIIKIDASFVTAADGNASAQARLKRIVSMAASIADAVVVEGVQSESQFASAKAAGATWVQGHLIAAQYRSNNVEPALSGIAFY